MRRLPRALSDAATLAGHRAGWAVVRRVPERAAYRLFDAVADLTVARGGAGRMRANYARVRPELDAAGLDDLVRDGMRSYLRYYCEAFRLPDLTAADVVARVRAEGDAPVRAVLADGGSVVCFLGHLGNWDLAGAWCGVELGPVTTVAERLEPEELFRDFVAFREGLGMTILPLTGGPDVFGALREAARTPTVVALLADRDLTRQGVTVDFCGLPARMAPGPGALALAERRPLFPVTVRHERRGSSWGVVVTFHPEVPVPASGSTREKVLAMTQACADTVGAVVREHTADWHMLQRVFVDDVDPARAREGPR